MKHLNKRQMLFHMLAKIHHEDSLDEVIMELGYLSGDYRFNDHRYYDIAERLVKQNWMELHNLGE